MKATDPLNDPEAEEFVWLDWETLVWVAVAWLVCVVLVAMIYLVDKMTEDILNVLPKDEKPKPE